MIASLCVFPIFCEAPTAPSNFVSSSILNDLGVCFFCFRACMQCVGGLQVACYMRRLLPLSPSTARSQRLCSQRSLLQAKEQSPRRRLETRKRNLAKVYQHPQRKRKRGSGHERSYRCSFSYFFKENQLSSSHCLIGLSPKAQFVCDSTQHDVAAVSENVVEGA